MEYFRTPLSPEEVAAFLNKHSTDPKKDYCVVEFDQKKSLIITNEDSVCTILMKEPLFKPVYISEPDLISLPVMHKVVSVSGNKELFTQCTNPKG